METNNINQDWEHTIWAQSTTNSIFLDQKSHGIAIRLNQFTLFASRYQINFLPLNLVIINMFVNTMSNKKP